MKKYRQLRRIQNKNQNSYLNFEFWTNKIHVGGLMDNDSIKLSLQSNKEINVEAKGRLISSSWKAGRIVRDFFHDRDGWKLEFDECNHDGGEKSEEE